MFIIVISIPPFIHSSVQQTEAPLWWVLYWFPLTEWWEGQSSRSAAQAGIAGWEGKTKMWGHCRGPYSLAQQEKCECKSCQRKLLVPDWAMTWQKKNYCPDRGGKAFGGIDEFWNKWRQWNSLDSNSLCSGNCELGLHTCSQCSRREWCKAGPDLGAPSCPSETEDRCHDVAGGEFCLLRHIWETG